MKPELIVPPPLRHRDLITAALAITLVTCLVLAIVVMMAQIFGMAVRDPVLQREVREQVVQPAIDRIDRALHDR